MANTPECDYLDLEFKTNLQVAHSFMKKMILADDRRVCDKYIRICLNMKKTDQVKVKLHRNRFFNYLLKTMKRTLETQKASIYVNPSQQALLNESEQNETKQWSPDRKSYVSMKIIPGFGTLIYMACTDNPDLGWDLKGFANFTDISDVPTSMDDRLFNPQQQQPGTSNIQQVNQATTSNLPSSSNAP